MTSGATREKRFFLVKHDLASLEALPGCIWNDKRGPRDEPRSYRQVGPRDKWIAYAYIRNEGTRESVSLVQGFFECVRRSEYGPLPQTKALDEAGLAHAKGWVIKGRQNDKQPRSPVLIPSIGRFLGKTLYTRSSVIPLKREDYWKIHDYALSHDEPLPQGGPFGFTPKTEQELLLAFAGSCRRIGVERIVSARTRFPDLVVGISQTILHVELELFSRNFFVHRHRAAVKNRRYNGRPVCVVCWVDDEKAVQNVLPVFELRDLISGRRSLTEALP